MSSLSLSQVVSRYLTLLGKVELFLQILSNYQLS